MVKAIKFNDSHIELLSKFMESLEIEDGEEKFKSFVEAYKKPSKKRAELPANIRCRALKKGGDERCGGRRTNNSERGFCNIHDKNQESYESVDDGENEEVEEEIEEKGETSLESESDFPTLEQLETIVPEKKEEISKRKIKSLPKKRLVASKSSPKNKKGKVLSEEVIIDSSDSDNEGSIIMPKTPLQRKEELDKIFEDFEE